MNLKTEIVCVFILAISWQVHAQDSLRIAEGKITYRNTQNIYARFDNTEWMSPGDTLFMMQDGSTIPVAVINHMSSISCVATPLGAVELEIDDPLFSVYHPQVIIPAELGSDSIPAPSGQGPIAVAPDEVPELEEDSGPGQSIRGRLSASWYSNYYSYDGLENNNKFRYVFALNAQNINDSRLSAETYISFRHEAGEWQEVQDNFGRAFKVYNLALTYETRNAFRFTLGRKFNPYMSNIGAIDGLQVEKIAGNFTFGGTVGSRPDYSDYGYNPDLFQMGAFVSYVNKAGTGNMQNTLAIFQQYNEWTTDRRFLYFQHTNNAIKDIYVFTSFEFDLYKVQDSTPMNVFDLTSAYVSLRYRASRKLMFFASYDARNNIVYYESYKNFLDQYLEEETRQGLRLRVNYRPVRYVSIGGAAGYRFQTNGQSPATNTNLYITHSRIPLINTSASLSWIYLKSSYLSGNVFGLRLYRDIVKGKIFGELQYRRVMYDYLNTSSTLDQNIFSGSVSWRLYKKLTMSIYYEGILDDRNKNNRFHLNVTQRF